MEWSEWKIDEIATMFNGAWLWGSLLSKIGWSGTDTVSGLVYPSKTNVADSVNDHISQFVSISACLKQRLKEGVRSLPHFQYFFETNNVPTQFYTAIYTPTDDNVDNGSVASSWVIKVEEPPVVDKLAVSLSSLELLKEQSYG